jgi:TonB family protein
LAQSPETEGAQETAAAGAVSKRVMPEILPAAQASIQGRVNVRIRVIVDAAGNVADAAVESQGTSRYFAKVAQDAARQWKFRPAQAGGQRVWVLAFEFTRAGTEVTPLAVR